MPKGDGQLRNAANNGDLTRVTALLAAGADPNAVGAGKTALLLAVTNEHAEVAEALVRAGADPCARAQGKMRPLSQAISIDRLDLAEMMLRTADPQRISPCLDDALRWAIIKANCDAIEMLVARGADVRGRTMGGSRSPLEMARWWHDGAHPDFKPKYKRVIDVLIRLGAT